MRNDHAGPFSHPQRFCETIWDKRPFSRPTLPQQLNGTEAALARFRRTLRKSDQYIFDGLFAAARRHTAAISQAESLLPFEAALLAILLEQAREIAILRQKVDLLTNGSDFRLVD